MLKQYQYIPIMNATSIPSTFLQSHLLHHLKARLLYYDCVQAPHWEHRSLARAPGLVLGVNTASVRHCDARALIGQITLSWLLIGWPGPRRGDQSLSLTYQDNNNQNQSHTRSSVENIREIFPS